MQSPLPQPPSNRSAQLRQWYLAGLRKQLFAASKNLTPAALVDADRRFIEEVILAEATGQAKPVVHDVLAGRLAPWLWCWLGGNVLLFVFLVVGNAGDLGASVLQAYQLTIGIFFLQGTGATVSANLAWLTHVYPAFFYGFPFVAVFSMTTAGR